MEDMVYMDGTQNKTGKEEILCHAPIHLLAELPANGWSPAAPHPDRSQVTGLLAGGIPLATGLTLRSGQSVARTNDAFISEGNATLAEPLPRKAVWSSAPFVAKHPPRCLITTAGHQ